MRRRPNDVLNALYSDLERLKDKHDKLVTAKELETSRQQVLLESIQAHEQVSAFKRDMEQQLQDALNDEEYLPQAPSINNTNRKAATHGAPNYVMSLLQTVTPELVQQVLSWQADDWHRFLTEAASTVSLLVQLTSRNGSHEMTTAASPQQQPHHELLAEQQLCEAVDHIVTVGALGAVYGEITGPQLGICTATNHITGAQEAPQQQHWQNALQQLQLSRPQLLKLSACFNEFTRQRKAQSQFQAFVASASACNNSCSLQLLAAGPRGLVMRPGSAPPDMGGAEAAEDSAAAAAARSGPPPETQGAASPVSACAAAGAGVTAASSGGCYTQSEGAATAGACSGMECSAPDPSHLMAHLLCMVNRSFIMAFMTLHNTLTRQQVAKMLVASFPYVPRAGPLMEAASQALLQGTKPSSMQRLTPDADEDGEVDGGQGDGEDSDD